MAKVRKLKCLSLPRGEVTLTLGGDPEFEVLDQSGELVRASDYFSFEGSIGTDGAGSQLELRPRPSTTPEGFVENVRPLVAKVANMGFILSTIGDHHPLGGHIHFGCSDPEVLIENVEDFLYVLDPFLGIPLRETNGRARGGYDVLSAWEEKPYGWEYRTPPVAYYAEFEMLRVVYKLAKGIGEHLLHEKELIFEVGPDGIPLSKYYLLFLTEEEVNYFFSFIERWRERSVNPFLPKEGVPKLFLSFGDDWYEEQRELFRAVVKKLEKELKKPVELYLYGLRKSRGVVWALPTAEDEVRLFEPPYPEVVRDSYIPYYRIGIPYLYRVEEVPSEKVLRWFESRLRELFEQEGLL